MKIAQYFTRRVRLSLYTLTALFITFGLFGFLALPGLIKPKLEQAASVALQRNVSIGKVEINPYLYRLTLRDVAVMEKDGPLLRFAALTVDAELSSLWRGGPVLREITLEAPEIRVVRLAANRYNFSDLLDKKPDSPEKIDTSLPRFSLNNIHILNGRIDFDDRLQNTHQQISELNLTLPFISTLPQRVDNYIEPGISGKLNGSSFRLAGQSKPFKDSRETRLSLALDKLDLPHYLSYVTLPKDVKLPNGKLSGQVDMVFRMEKDRASLLLEGKLGLHDGRLDFRGEQILALPTVQVELKELEPLTQKFRFAHIGLDKPIIHISRSASGELNWLTAFASGKSTKSASIPAAALPLIDVESLTVEDGRIEWKDAGIKPVHAERVEAIGIKAQHLSTAAKASSPVSISFKTGHGESFKSDLQVQADPLAAEGRIELGNIQPGRHAPYLKPFFAGDIASGQISTALNFRFNAKPLTLEISQGTFGVENLAVRLAGDKQPALKAAAIHASGISIDLGKKYLELAKFQAKGTEVVAIHNKDDSFNLLKLLPPQTANAKPAANEAPWRFKIMQLALENNSLRLEDRRQDKNPPLTLNGINLQAQNLDTTRGSQSQLTLSAHSGKRGQIKVSGPFTPQPFSAKWQLDIQDFDAAFVQSYLSQHLNVQLASIWLNAKGETQIATEPKVAVRYRGNLAVNNFLAIDRVNGANFLRWRTLALNGINAQSEPAKLDLNEIALSDFYSRLILSKNGRLNLQDILVQNGQATSITSGDTASAPATRAEPVAASALAKSREPLPPIRIGKVKLAKGNINYTDNFIQPNFTANLTDMGGEISGLSNKADTRASVDLRGSVDRIAPVTVTGSLNPLAQQIFLDIKAAVKGYELTAASTYSAKYAGYGIEKGKLSMDVAYFIENNKLKATNQLFLDQLTLGDKVDSPEATKLPIKFALALLTDRRGQINLSLPIEGSLDDPQFRIGRIIWQVIGNLLEKAVTSPFSALGSLFGDSEESFSRVEFDPGRSALSNEAKASLSKLAQALNDRPALKLDIIGWVDPVADREGVRRNKLKAKVRARKVEQQTDKGQSIEQDERTVTQEEYPKLLSQVYSQEKFAKPRNVVGLAKSLPTTEMEKLIMANTPVSDDELNTLAMRRATTVKDALKAAGLDDSRLFILKSRLDPPADVLKKDGGKAMRVQFVLK